MTNLCHKLIHMIIFECLKRCKSDAKRSTLALDDERGEMHRNDKKKPQYTHRYNNNYTVNLSITYRVCVGIGYCRARVSEIRMCTKVIA